jgi:hypothetical protein
MHSKARDFQDYFKIINRIDQGTEEDFWRDIWTDGGQNWLSSEPYPWLLWGAMMMMYKSQNKQWFFP